MAQIQVSGRLILALALQMSMAGAPVPASRLWSLQPVKRAETPAVPGKTFINPIDAFLTAKHREKKLKPVGFADRATLLRRVYLDLIGLPPSPEEIEAFLCDTSETAWENIVDKLLASEQHGVRYARHWLDVLRYADVDEQMPASPGIYLWREWMITELNRDIPYDQFVRAQITGNRSKIHSTLTATGYRVKVEGRPEDLLAQGFLSRGATTRDDKGQDLAMSAVETISTAFLGMTVGCAKCHDHRYDPITQKDYYSMKALFDPLRLKKTVLATPAEVLAHGRELDIYERTKAPLDAAIAKLTDPYRDQLYNERLASLPEAAQSAIKKPEGKRTIDEQKIYDDYYPILRIDPVKIKEVLPPEELTKYEDLTKQLGRIPRPADLSAIWVPVEDTKRLSEPSYILNTGDPLRPEMDKPVGPGFPFMPANYDFREGRREGFVDWLTAAENPLFARVAVNRIWQWHFGEGLQKNPSDFGILGGKPANQELLDFLAAEFVSHDYSMKWLHKLIVTSDAYKLDSKASPMLAKSNVAIDPNNRYLWRFRVQRMQAEQIWDSVLAASGELDITVGGRSFQFETEGMRRPGGPARGPVIDSNANRRGAYMVRGYSASRDVMPNFLQVFDVDDGRAPCPMRQQTVTAPQSLLLMNSDFIEKASTKMAEAVLKQSSGDLAAAVDLSYRKVLARPVLPAEKDTVLTFLGSDTSRLKALTWSLFNLDEFVYIK